MNKRKGLTVKLFSYIVLFIFILSLIPLIAISFYNHPCADDYSYSIPTAEAWRETGSLFETVKAGINKTDKVYDTWQGSFTGVFLMTMQPAIFGGGFYSLSSLLMLASFIFANMLFFYAILIKWLKLDKHIYMIIGLLLTAVSIQFVPSPAQAFYWYNGSVYYTFFYSLCLITVSLLLLAKQTDKKPRFIIYSVIAGLISFFIGGGNYVTVLIMLIIALFISVYSIWKKERIRWTAMICLILLAAAFIISASAPGNAFRQGALGETMPPVKAVFKSLISAFIFIGANTNAPMLILLAFISPFLYYAASKADISFKLPLPAVGIAFCIFAASFTPTLYATQKAGAGRIENITFYLYILFMSFSIFYISGWINKKLRSQPEAQALPSRLKNNILTLARKYCTCIVILTALIFGLTCMTQKGLSSLSSYSAAKSLLSGQASQYKAEEAERLKLLNDPDIKDVVLKPYSVKPPVLFFDDITSDPSDWRNKDMARFWNKDSIALIP